jgi:hypothetical protein
VIISISAANVGLNTGKLNSWLESACLMPIKALFALTHHNNEPLRVYGDHIINLYKGKTWANPCPTS